MNKRYTGVGSREAPPEVLLITTALARALAEAGYVVRSGGAPGMDTAFEDGAREAGSDMEIFLAWKGFNGNTSPLYGVSPEAMTMAATVHPAWDRLSDAARKLHARNCNQVLGKTLNDPSEFLVCWTPDGCETEASRTRNTGGTATAIVLAARNNVPVFNLKNRKSCIALNEFLKARGVPYQMPVPDAPLQQGALFGFTMGCPDGFEPSIELSFAGSQPAALGL
jgi:hypothetical protein